MQSVFFSKYLETSWDSANSGDYACIKDDFHFDKI